MLKDLLAQYDHETSLHSLAGPMMAKESFKEIVAQGEAALPEILTYLKDHGGMNIMLLLMTITKENPLPPKPVAPGFVGYNVRATQQAWLDWGREKGHLTA